MKRLVVVKTGWRLPLRFFAFRTFAALGWRVAVVDRIVNQSLRCGDVSVISDLADMAAVAEAVRARLGPPDGVLTLNDSGLVAAARLAALLGLPHLPVEVARRAVDKREQRRAFAAAGLPVPEWRTLTDAGEAAAAVREWGRAVVKPADRAASVAVRLVRTAAEAESAYREAAAAARRPGPVLVERHLDGPEVSVESVPCNGRQRAICVTDKVITAGPRFVELGHAVPSALGPRDRDAVAEAAASACAALGLDRVACHTEVKLTGAGPVVVEVNPRLPGDCVPDLIQLALGVNAYELAGRVAFGEAIGPADLAPRRRGAAAIHFRTACAGVFQGAASELEAAPPPWLVELSVTAAPGERMADPQSNGDRIGYAIATGDRAPEAAGRARAAIESLSVSVT